MDNGQIETDEELNNVKYKRKRKQWGRRSIWQDQPAQKQPLKKKKSNTSPLYQPIGVEAAVQSPWPMLGMLHIRRHRAKTRLAYEWISH